jgi:hypothetical protein
MDFSLTTLFVATTGTLATTGGPQNLPGGQLGIFNPDYTVADTGTIAAQPYIYIAEGRIEVIPGLGSKRSDKIAANRIIEWYKVTAVKNADTQISQIGSWNIECDQEITFTFVLHSNYIDSGFFNGLTRSVVVKSPCCNCGANPCATITGTDIDNLIDQAVAKINLVTSNSPIVAGNDLSRFIVASRVGTGSSALLVITEKPLDVYGNPCDFEAYPWEYDRLWFRAFAVNGPFTTQDFEVYDSCNIAATVTVNQRSAYLNGTSGEIAQLEKNLYSYQSSMFKSLYSNNAWNQAFTSYVVAGTYYDTYYIKYYPYGDVDAVWNPGVVQDETVIIAIANGSTSAWDTLINAYLGTPVNQSATNPTSTTTTSTTSTSTSSTTTLIP